MSDLNSDLNGGGGSTPDALAPGDGTSVSNTTTEGASGSSSTVEGVSGTPETKGGASGSNGAGQPKTELTLSPRYSKFTEQGTFARSLSDSVNRPTADSSDESEFERFQMQPLDDKWDSLPNIPQDTLERIVGAIKESNLVVISTTSYDLGHAAVYALIERLEINPQNCRKIINLASGSGAGFNMNDMISSEKKTDEEELYVVDAHGGGAKLLDTLTHKEVEARSIKRKLQEQQRVCIYLAPQKQIDISYITEEKKEDAVKKSLGNSRQLQQAFLRAFPTAAELKMVVRIGVGENLEEIVENGPLSTVTSNLIAWAISHGKLVKLIEAAFDENPGNPELRQIGSEHRILSQEVLYYPCVEMILATEYTRNPAVDISAQYDNDIFTASALFVATFFPNLNPRDFIRVSAILCKNATRDQILQADRQRGSSGSGGSPTIPLKSMESGHASIRSEKDIENVLQRIVDVLKREQLLSVKILTDETWIELASGDIKKELEEHILEHHFFESRNQFAALIDAGLLFDTSRQVMFGAIDLSVRMMEASPGTEPWIEWFEALLTNRLNSMDASVSTPALEKIINCLSNLFRVMLSSSKTGTGALAEEFYRCLLKNKFFWIAFNVALDLKNTSVGKNLRWLENCVNQASGPSLEVIRSTLARFIKRKGQDVTDAFDLIQQWIPDMNDDSGRYTPLNRLAFTALFDYMLDIVDELIDEINQPKSSLDNVVAARAKGVMKISLFLGIGDGSPLSERRFKLLLSWLFHPCAELMFDQLFSTVPGDNQSEEYRDFLFGYIFPHIFLALSYAELIPDTKDSAISIRDALILQIAIAVSMKNRRSRGFKTGILNTWMELGEFLFQESRHAAERQERNTVKGMMRLRSVLLDTKKKLTESIRDVSLPENM